MAGQALRFDIHVRLRPLAHDDRHQQYFDVSVG